MINGIKHSFLFNEKNGSNFLLKRFFLCLALTGIILLVSYRSVDSSIAEWVEFILASLIVIICAGSILINAWNSFIKRDLNRYTLIGLAILSVYLYAIYLLSLSPSFPYFFSISVDAESLFTILSIIITIILFEQIIEGYILEKNFQEEIKWNLTNTEKTLKLINHFFIIIVILIGILTLIMGINQNFLAFISVLIIACPTAFILAFPLTFISGIKCAKRQNVIIKNPVDFLQMEKINVIILDSVVVKNSNASLVLESLHNEDIYLVMLTNNNNLIEEEKTAEKYNIEAIETVSSPEEKAEVIKRLKMQGFVIADLSMDEFGMNLRIDQNPDLDIKFQGHSLLNIVFVRKLSKKVMTIVRQNLFISVIYNIVALPLAAGVYYFWTGYILNPIMSTILMSICTLLIIMNSLRLQRHV